MSTMTARPARPHGKIAMMWDLFDSATGEITSKHIPAIAEKTGFNETTVRIQFYRWKASQKANLGAEMKRAGSAKHARS